MIQETMDGNKLEHIYKIRVSLNEKGCNNIIL